MDATIRKLENNLYTIGMGIIVLSAWSLLKLVLTSIFSEEFRASLPEHYEIATMIVVMVYALIDMLVRIYVGIAAIKVSRGKKKSVLYLIVTVLIGLMYTLEIVLEVFLLITTQSGYVTYIVTILINITSMVFWVELTVYAIRLKSLRKLQAQGGSYES